MRASRVRSGRRISGGPAEGLLTRDPQAAAALRGAGPRGLVARLFGALLAARRGRRGRLAPAQAHVGELELCEGVAQAPRLRPEHALDLRPQRPDGLDRLTQLLAVALVL